MTIRFPLALTPTMFSFDFDIKSAKSHFFDVQAIKARTAPES